MGLLAADLRALTNLPRDPIGRRLLVHLAVGLGILGLLSWWLASNLLERPELLALAHRQSGGNSQASLLGMGLIPCPMAATWLGLSLAQRQLFETPELGLWQSAPIAPWRGAVQILLRASFMAVVWAAALSAPFLVTLLLHWRAPALAWVLLPAAIVAATVPLIATLLVVQIALVRLFAGRVLRVVLTTLGAAASVGFSTWLLVILFSGSEGGGQLLGRAAGAESLPWTVDSGTALLAAAVRGDLDTGALGAELGWLVFAAVLFVAGARLHPRAVDSYRLAEPPLRRRRSSWPAGVTATIRKKELAQVVQQPGALIGFLIFAFLVFALVERRVLVGGILEDYRLPAELRHLGAMLAQWFLATMLVLYPHMGRLAQWDGAQWSLYVTSPAKRSAVLAGKLEAVWLLLLWPLVLVGAVGSHALGASTHTVLLFLGVTLAGTLVAVAVLAIVGTTPWLVRPDEGGSAVQGGRGFFASLLLILAFKLAVAPAGFGWIWLSYWARYNELTPALLAEWTPAVLGAGWLWALAMLGLGFGLGTRNYRRLSSPR